MFKKNIIPILVLTLDLLNRTAMIKCRSRKLVSEKEKNLEEKLQHPCTTYSRPLKTLWNMNYEKLAVFVPIKSGLLTKLGR